jgi:hypothetical protein
MRHFVQQIYMGHQVEICRLRNQNDCPLLNVKRGYRPAVTSFSFLSSDFSEGASDVFWNPEMMPDPISIAEQLEIAC